MQHALWNAGRSVGMAARVPMYAASCLHSELHPCSQLDLNVHASDVHALPLLLLLLRTQSARLARQ
jgi:hypothetical protein